MVSLLTRPSDIIDILMDADTFQMQSQASMFRRSYATSRVAGLHASDGPAHSELRKLLVERLFFSGRKLSLEPSPFREMTLVDPKAMMRSSDMRVAHCAALAVLNLVFAVSSRNATEFSGIVDLLLSSAEELAYEDAETHELGTTLYTELLSGGARLLSTSAFFREGESPKKVAAYSVEFILAGYPSLLRCMIRLVMQQSAKELVKDSADNATAQVERCLREFPPFPYLRRNCVQTWSNGSVSLLKDSVVVCSLASEEPHVKGSHNHHLGRFGLAFGAGPHRCPMRSAVVPFLKQFYRKHRTISS